MSELIEFLMIEDNPGDIRLNREYLKEYKIPCHLSVVDDDVEALRFLHHKGEYSLAILPDLILINIRVLWWDNASLVKQIKCDVTLEHIPIVLLTAFEGEEAIFGNNLPIALSTTKPLNWKSVIDIVEYRLTLP